MKKINIFASILIVLAITGCVNLDTQTQDNRLEEVVIDIVTNNSDRHLRWSMADMLVNQGTDTPESTRTEIRRIALQNEIEISLMNLNYIKEANVHLVMADPASYVFKDGYPSYANVTVYLTRQVDNMEVEQLVNIIADLVTGISADNIVIVDQTMRKIYNGLATEEYRFGGIFMTGSDSVSIKRMHMENDIHNLFEFLYNDIRVSINMALIQSEIIETVEYSSAITSLDSGQDIATGVIENFSEPYFETISDEFPVFSQNDDGEWSIVVGNPHQTQLDLIYNTFTERRSILAGTFISELTSADVIAYTFIYHSEKNLIEEGIIDGDTNVTWLQFQQDNNLLVWLNTQTDVNIYTHIVANTIGIPTENVRFTLIGIPRFISKN
ncbi:MAG: hypothetical protein FWC91_06135 [Defluviitaleaceae bacterium]|nr:hypothetical protein [Defluviitaleaceae bacterium]